MRFAAGDRKDLTPDEQDAVRSQLRREISTVWHTDELHRTRPTPTDEVRGGLAVLEQSLWHALPRLPAASRQALRSQTGRGLPIDASPIRFGSWIGGDRDGNPNVTAKVTREAVFLCRWTATKLFHDEVDALCQELSMDTASDALRERAGTDREPYRALLRTERSALAAALRRIEDELDGLQSGKAVLRRARFLICRPPVVDGRAHADASLPRRDRAAGRRRGPTSRSNSPESTASARTWCGSTFARRPSRHAQVLDELTRHLGTRRVLRLGRSGASEVSHRRAWVEATAHS